MKTDARVRYTKRTITDSFIQLLHKKPLEKITVKKICEDSLINRSTFYKYYEDPYDLLQQIEDEALEAMREHVEKSNGKEIETMLNSALHLILEQRDFYQCIFFKRDLHTFHEKLLMLCYQLIPLERYRVKQFSSFKEQEWYYYFLAQGSASVLDCWVREGMKEEPEYLSQFIGKMHHNFP